MSYPYDLAIGPDHCLYVCEYGNHRVQKFTLDGQSAGHLGHARAAGRGSSITPMPWPSTAGATSRSSTRTTIACSGSGSEAVQAGRTGSWRIDRRCSGNWSITVGNPWWLILIPLVLPPLVWMSYRSLAGLGPVRRALAILFRTAVITLIVLALAELQSVRRTDRLTTIFLLDVSNSVPARAAEGRARLRDRGVEEAAARTTWPGVVVFGKEPRVEVPPAPSELNLLGIESTIDPENTDLGAAVKLALATFPEDTARRIVVLSDGNENRGNLLRAGPDRQVAGRAGRRPADRVLLRPRGPGREGVDPSRRQEGRDGQHQRRDPRQRADPRARCRSSRRPTTTGRRPPATSSPSPIELQRGINVFTLKQLITEPNFYTFSAEFIPDKGSGDQRAINNMAEGFTHARGKAQVLLIEGTRGEHAELVKALREKEIEVKVLAAPKIDGSGGVGGDPLPTDLAQLQPYDAVILANVPKEAFTESQHQLLASNCHDMGAGLVMLGGRDSFGAGGWMNTPVEKALPVDMQIKAIKVQGIGAMVADHARQRDPRGELLAEGRRQGGDQRPVELRLRRAAPLGGPGSVALHPAADRLGPSQHAPRDRPHDARRHARLRPVAPDGHEGLERRPGRDEQAHRRHQRRRPDAAQPRA